MENKQELPQEQGRGKEKRSTVKFPWDVYDALVDEAKKRDRSLHQQIIYSLRVGLGMVENGTK